MARAEPLYKGRLIAPAPAPVSLLIKDGPDGTAELKKWGGKGVDAPALAVAESAVARQGEVGGGRMSEGAVSGTVRIEWISGGFGERGLASVLIGD